MKLILRSMVDTLNDEIAAARARGRVVERIELTPAEHRELLAEMNLLTLRRLDVYFAGIPVKVVPTWRPGEVVVIPC